MLIEYRNEKKRAGKYLSSTFKWNVAFLNFTYTVFIISNIVSALKATNWLCIRFSFLIHFMGRIKLKLPLKICGFNMATSQFHPSAHILKIAHWLHTPAWSLSQFWLSPGWMIFLINNSFEMCAALNFSELCNITESTFIGRVNHLGLYYKSIFRHWFDARWAWAVLMAHQFLILHSALGLMKRSSSLSWAGMQHVTDSNWC